MGDLSYYLSPDGNPTVKQWLENNLLKPRCCTWWESWGFDRWFDCLSFLVVLMNLLMIIRLVWWVIMIQLLLNKKLVVELNSFVMAAPLLLNPEVLGAGIGAIGSWFVLCWMVCLIVLLWLTKVAHARIDEIPMGKFQSPQAQVKVLAVGI